MSLPILSGHRLTRSSKPRRLSLTPLIDVVFMLLLFFMLATSFSQWRVLDLIRGETGDMKSLPLSTQSSLLRVYPDRLESAGKQTTVAQFAADISGLADDAVSSTSPDKAGISQGPTPLDRKVIVWVQEDVFTQRLITILDELRVLGITNPTLSIQSAHPAPGGARQ